MSTVTVRFAPSRESQSELHAALGRAVEAVLRRSGLDERVSVEPVFPGDDTAKWKGAFVVKFSSTDHRLIDALEAVPGVQSAYLAPSRNTLR